MNFHLNAIKFFQNFFSMTSQRLLFAIDFDHTLVDCNSDVHIRSLAPNGVLPEDIKSLARSPKGWTFFMQQVFIYLYKNGIKQSDYYKSLSKIPLVNGMKELLQKVHISDGCEAIVISDANSIFIKYVLQHNELQDTVSRIYTNPACFDADGCLKIQEYHIQDFCNICSHNMCKGFILEKHISQKKDDSIKFDKVIYIGDGRNDVCPALKLDVKDYVFARINFPLLTKLENLANKVKAKIIPWETATDIEQFFFQCSK